MRYSVSLTMFLWCSFLAVSCVGSLGAEQWQQSSSDHFFVYFNGDEKFAKDVLMKAETYYRQIASDLGYPRYSEFWTWDKRVKIYIYPTAVEFRKATGQPNWSQGVADYRSKTISSYTWSTGFTESLLPHEMAHLIFRDFVGFRGEIPLWLDEGVAQWEEAPKREIAKQVALRMFNNDGLLSINDMMRLDIRKIKENDQIYIRSTKTKVGEPGILFMSGENLINSYYVQAVSLVGFLIEKYGSVAFADFCRQLRDGKSVEEALRFSHPTHIRSTAELEEQWKQYLGEQH